MMILGVLIVALLLCGIYKVFWGASSGGVFKAHRVLAAL